MSARSRAASWAQKRAIANPFHAEIPTSPPNVSDSFADPLHHGLVAGHDQRGADGDAAFGDGGLREFCADIAVEPDGFGKHQPAATAQPPAVDELAMQHLFAHRRAAEHHDFAEQKRGVIGQIDIDAPRDPRAVEQDGLLRQPGKVRARLGPERNVELGRRSRRAIDLLGRRRRQRQPRALTGRNIDVETVAAGDAAGRVDEHAGQAVVLGRGKPDAERAGFMQSRRGG